MKTIATATGLLVLCLVFGPLAEAENPHPPLTDFEELRGYGSWQEVTDGPHEVLPEVWALCVPPPPGHGRPHPGSADIQGKGRYIRVFATSPAAALMRSPRVDRFPTGTTVAKVKLIDGSSEPAGVAFMVKREPGYNPEGRDWEYFLFEGKPLRLSARGAISTCQGCHGSQDLTDGLYRSYLSDGQEEDRAGG